MTEARFTRTEIKGYAIRYVGWTLLIATIIYIFSLHDNYKDIDEQLRAEHFRGYVQNKYMDSTQRNADYVEIIINEKPATFFISKDSIYCAINIGDYIIKDTGTRDLILIKSNDTLIFKM